MRAIPSCRTFTSSCRDGSRPSTCKSPRRTSGRACRPAASRQVVPAEPFAAFPELAVQCLRGVHVHVDADQVDQRTRSERPAGAVRHRLVHVLGQHVRFVENPHAVVEQRDQDPIDDEAGSVVAPDRLLARTLRPLLGGVDCGVGAPRCTHDLNQRQDRRRVEEVHPDDALGSCRGLRDLGDRQRRRVRCEHGVLPVDPVELSEHFALELELLEYRLDDEVARGEVRRSVVSVSRPSAASRSSAVIRPFSTPRVR